MNIATGGYMQAVRKLYAGYMQAVCTLYAGNI